MSGPWAGLPEFGARADAAIGCITEFFQQVVIHRKVSAIRGWRNWVTGFWRILLFIRLSGYVRMWSRLLRFLSCDPKDTVDGSGVLVEPHALDEQFRKASMPFFCREGEGNADLDAFRAVAEELTPLLNEVQLSPLSGDMLYESSSEKEAYCW